jgi:hypothetical protein
MQRSLWFFPPSIRMTIRVSRRRERRFVLFWHIIHSPHDVFRLPPGVLDKPNKVQRVQRAYEPRLHVHPPHFFIFLLLFPATIVLTIVGRRKVTPLALDDLRERLVPVVHVDHPPRLEVAPEEDARVWQLPYGQALRRRVIVRRRKERVGLEKCRYDGGAGCGIKHLRSGRTRA